MGDQDTGKSTFIRQYLFSKKIIRQMSHNKFRLSFSEDEIEERATTKQEKSIKNYVSDNLDIQKLNFVYKNQVSLMVELWDTAGQERYNPDFLYSQSYLRGKNGVILICDGTRLTSANSNLQQEVSLVVEKLTMIEQSVNCPVLLIINFVDSTPEQLKHLSKVA